MILSTLVLLALVEELMNQALRVTLLAVAPVLRSVLSACDSVRLPVATSLV
jgi:hypothetical protein